MGDPYPSDFSQQSRARIEAIKIQAGLELDDSKRDLRWLSDVEAAVRKYILRGFLAFAEQALILGRQGLWNVDRIERESREFLWHLTLEAMREKGHDQRGQPIGCMVDRVFSRILPEVRREFERSSEWRQYQEGLLEVAQIQALGMEQSRAIDQPGTPKADAAVKSPSGGSRPKLLRRGSNNDKIDQALRQIAEVQPKGHEEVFRLLEGRAKVPDAKPFASTGEWTSGFRRDKAAARAWLSKAWSRLNLPPFPRGPKL
jgi:hypothetical protein